jgi:hypothetical protein
MIYLCRLRTRLFHLPRCLLQRTNPQCRCHCRSTFQRLTIWWSRQSLQATIRRCPNCNHINNSIKLLFLKLVGLCTVFLLLALSLCLSVCRFVSLLIFLSISLSLCLSVCRFVSLLIFLSISLSLCLSVALFLCDLSLYISVSLRSNK